MDNSYIDHNDMVQVLNWCSSEKMSGFKKYLVGYIHEEICKLENIKEL